MDLSPVTTTQSFDDTDDRWRASDHGVDCMESITLKLDDADLAELIEADPVTAGYSFLPAGIPLKKSSTLYIRNDTGAACDGHLYKTVRFKTGATKAGGSLFWHGAVYSAQIVAVDSEFVASTDGARQIRYR